jgi:hypothetical protein
MAEKYQSSGKKSNRKFEVWGAKQLAMHLPLPLVEVWEELQPQVEHLTGFAGLKIVRAVIEDEVTQRVGPPHRPERRRARCAGGVSRATWCSAGRRWR